MGSTKVEAEMGVGTDFLICAREVDCGNLLPNWIAAAINPQTPPPCPPRSHERYCINSGHVFFQSNWPLQNSTQPQRHPHVCLNRPQPHMLRVVASTTALSRTSIGCIINVVQNAYDYLSSSTLRSIVPPGRPFMTTPKVGLAKSLLRRPST